MPHALTIGTMSTIAILGAGMMGSAFAVPLADRGHQVRLVGTHLDDAIIAALAAGAPHPKLGERLPEAIVPYGVGDLERAMEGVDILAVGVSSAGIEWVANALAPYVSPAKPIVMITKGLARTKDGLRVLPDELASLLPPASAPVAVAGPCIAGELARRVPTCVLFTGRDVEIARALAESVRGDYYRVFVESDVVGAEVAAALKNAYALGIALGAGLHESRGGAPGSIAMHNYESAVFAQSIVEMRRIIGALGGNPDVASGLAGVGDLDVTCNGGRTGRFGRLLGLGLGRDEAIAQMQGATLECLEILEVVRDALPSLGAAGLTPDELPLFMHLAEIALDGARVAMPFDRFFGAR
jgi:glycerol-3-phosphate dehydrogenase (NAD(P)+)